MTENRFDVVGIGVTVWDTVMQIASLPASGEVMRATGRTSGIGGGVAVAVATAARLGSRTAMADSLGDDEAAKSIVDALEGHGVDTSCVARVSEASSSLASIWSETDCGERTIVYSPGAASDRLTWTDDIEAMVRDSKVLHVNGRHLDVCDRAVKVAERHGTPVSFDGGAFRYRDEIVPLLRKSQIVIVAREFAERHVESLGANAGDLSVQQLLAALRDDLPCELLGITDGRHGSYLVARGEKAFHQPAIGVSGAVDTTGCGDTYHGAFLQEIARSNDVRKAAHLASRIAGKNAAAMGALAFTR